MDPFSLDEIFTQILEFLKSKRQNQTWGVRKEETKEMIVVHKILNNDLAHTGKVALPKTELDDENGNREKNPDHDRQVDQSDISDMLCLQIIDICSVKNERTNGEILNGKILNGEIPNGEILNGEIPNGEILNGEISNGEISNGDVTSKLESQQSKTNAMTKGSCNHSAGCVVKLERIDLDHIDDSDGHLVDNDSEGHPIDVSVREPEVLVGAGTLPSSKPPKVQQKGKKSKKKGARKNKTSTSKPKKPKAAPKFQPFAKKGKLKEEENDPDFNPKTMYKPLKKRKPIKPIKPARPAGRPLRFPDMAKDENGIYNCPRCPAKYKSHSSAHAHYTKYHHDPVDISCDLCPMKFKYKQQFDAHHDYVHNDGSGRHVCANCGMRYKLFQNLKRHDHYKHYKKDNIQKGVPCRFCDVMLTPNSPEKEVHLINEHKDKLLFCSICSKHTETEKMMHHHIRVKHNRVSPQLVSCIYCKYEFVTKDSLLYHYDEMHEDQETHAEKQFVCQIEHCQKRFRSQALLKRHDLWHERKNKRLASTIANAKAKWLVANENYITTDSSPCPSCGKIIVDTKMKEHMKCHEKPTFACEECGKVFYSSSTLKNHRLQKHIKIELICPIESCGKIFHRRDVLKNHIAGVHGDKPILQCDQCEKTFAYKGDLTTHVRGVHQGKMSHCCVCGKEFVRPSEKNRHEKQVHNLDNVNSRKGASFVDSKDNIFRDTQLQ